MDYETTIPDPSRFGTGWEFKIPERGEAFFSEDPPLRLLGRDWWEPKKTRYGGRRWSKKVEMVQHTIVIDPITTVRSCPTCGESKITKEEWFREYK